VQASRVKERACQSGNIALCHWNSHVAHKMMISMMMCLPKSQDDDSMMMCLSKSQDDYIMMIGMAKKKMAQFRTRDLTKELAYVSTQRSGQDTMDTKMIEKNVSNWPDC
jgi:hypothetical protein